MKVLLRADIKGIGRRGDIVQVKPGYARNFLLPKGSAVIATDATETQSAAMRKARDLRHAIVMAEHLKELGKAQVKVNLFDGVIAGIEVEVVAK